MFLCKQNKVKSIKRRRQNRQKARTTDGGKSRCFDAAAQSDYLSAAFQYHDALEDAETCAKIASQLKIPENLICRFEYSQNA